jgi:predicted aldo/keto reductase-like oxidoreductase
MYADGYGNYELARSTYDELQQNESAFACSNCTECVAHCANGLNIADKMQKARMLFA